MTKHVPWFKALMPPVLLILAGVLAYGNSFDGVFLYDDLVSIRDNPHIRVLWPLREAMSLPLWSSAATVDGRPLLSLSFALNHWIFGPEPWGYHLVNLLIHIVAGLLLFGIVRRTLDLPRFRERCGGRGTWLALATALIWLVHPLQTESVTYMVQRAESLMGMLFLLTMYCAIRGLTGEGGGRIHALAREATGSIGRQPVDSQGRRWYAAAVLACAMGMGVKQTMFSVPLLVLLYDGLFVSDSIRAALAKRRWFYTSLCATWLIVFGIIVATWKESTIDFVQISPLGYALTQPLVILHYLRLAFWPSPLVLSYGPGLEDQWQRIVFPGLAVLSLLAVTIWGIRRRHWIGFVGAWFFLILAPTSSLAPMRQSIAEHRMYLSLAAVVLLAVVAAATVIRTFPAALRRPRALGGLLVLGVVAVFMTLTWERNRDYHSALAMWQHNVAHQPESSLAHLNLGNALQAMGRSGVAIEHYRQAVRIQPDYAEAHNNLGNVLLESGRPQEAMACYRNALQAQPRLADAHYNLGNALQALGRTQETLDLYRQAVRLRPDYVDAHNNLGNALLALGRPQDAIPHYQDALRIQPDFASACNNLGNAQLKLGRVEDAIESYRRGVALQPGDARLYYNLGFALESGGRLSEALRNYRLSVQINPGHAAAHFRLGLVYGERGQQAEAIQHFEQAVRLKPDSALARENLRQARARSLKE